MPNKQVGSSIGIGATVKIRHFRFVNQCNRCGICCTRLIEWQMTQADPDKPKGQLHKGKCVYLSGQAGEGKTTSCEIRDGTVDIETIPLHHKNYYIRECAPFDGYNGTWPNPDDPAHWPTTGTIVKPLGLEDTGCTFRKVIVTQQN